MAKGSGGTRGAAGGGSGSKASAGGGSIPNTPQAVQSVKNSIMNYSKTDKWNKNAAYNAGFNDDVQGAIEKLAKGNYGFPSQIAKTVTSKPGWSKSGATVTEKQAYHLAKGIIDNKLASPTGAFANAK